MRWLGEEIKETDPKVIVPLGGTALKALLGLKSIKQARGRKIVQGGRTFFPMYHPAAIGYDPRLTDTFIKDMSVLFDESTTAEMKVPEVHIVSPEEILRYLRDKKEFAFDLETTGKDPWATDAKILCIGVCAEDDIGLVSFYSESDIAVWRKVFDLPCEIIAQNGNFDVLYLQVVVGITVNNFVWDTKLLSYVLDPASAKHDLAYMVAVHLPEYAGYKTVFKESVRSKSPKKSVSMTSASRRQLAVYNGTDAVCTFTLKKRVFVPRLEKEGLTDYYHTILHPLNGHLRTVRSNGAKIDLQASDALANKLFASIQAIDLKLSKTKAVEAFLRLHPKAKMVTTKLGEKSAWASPNVKREILYVHCGLDTTYVTPETGMPSTEKDIIARFDHPVARGLVERSTLVKLLTTYTGTAVRKWVKSDGLAHSNFNIDTETGRLSSSGPNLQNIPRKSTSGSEYNIKSLFISRWPDGKVASGDYSQIELRIFAVLANCRHMLSVFSAGGDIHEAVAREVFSIPADEPVAENIRSDAKRVNFGVLYGESEIGLHEQHGKTIKYWRDFLRRYNELYPEVGEFRDHVVRQIIKNGYVESPFGSRRWFPNYAHSDDRDRSSMEREAVNSPIQNAASMLTDLSSMRITEAFREKGLQSLVIDLIHDMILMDLYPGEENRALGIAKKIMENPKLPWLKVKTPVEFAVGSSWGTQEKL